jgi:hypothetical protein
MGTPEEIPFARTLRNELMRAIAEDAQDSEEMTQAGLDPDNVDHQDAWHRLKCSAEQIGKTVTNWESVDTAKKPGALLEFFEKTYPE